MNTKKYSVIALVAALPLALVALEASPAVAGPFDGKIVTSSKRIPTSGKSKGAYFKKLRKQSTSKFQENTEKKQWKIHYAAFFRKPLNDLEVTVKLYDVTDRTPMLKDSFEVFLPARGQKNLISSLKIDRERYGVNRKIQMVVENRRRKLAVTNFQILGEAEKFSGKVDFTEEETKGP